MRLLILSIVMLAQLSLAQFVYIDTTTRRTNVTMSSAYISIPGVATNAAYTQSNPASITIGDYLPTAFSKLNADLVYVSNHMANALSAAQATNIAAYQAYLATNGWTGGSGGFATNAIASQDGYGTNASLYSSKYLDTLKLNVTTNADFNSNTLHIATSSPTRGQLISSFSTNSWNTYNLIGSDSLRWGYKITVTNTAYVSAIGMYKEQFGSQFSATIYLTDLSFKRGYTWVSLTTTNSAAFNYVTLGSPIALPPGDYAVWCWGPGINPSWPLQYPVDVTFAGGGFISAVSDIAGFGGRLMFDLTYQMQLPSTVNRIASEKPLAIDSSSVSVGTNNPNGFSFRVNGSSDFYGSVNAGSLNVGSLTVGGVPIAQSMSDADLESGAVTFWATNAFAPIAAANGRYFLWIKELVGVGLYRHVYTNSSGWYVDNLWGIGSDGRYVSAMGTNYPTAQFTKFPAGWTGTYTSPTDTNQIIVSQFQTNGTVATLKSASTSEYDGGAITNLFPVFTNAAGSKFKLVVNSTTNGFVFVPQ